MDRDAGFVLNLIGGVGGFTSAAGVVSALESDGNGGAHLMPPEQVGLPSLGPRLVETLAASAGVGPGTATKSVTFYAGRLGADAWKAPTAGPGGAARQCGLTWRL